jgi:tetratricopeptide (TPR) repeat protein
MHDGSPLAKVIDFGIAKATMGRLIDQTLHTEVDQIMGTPAYISPEQARPTHAGIDTRSDIYSLGVLLYELLTSHTPFDVNELAEAGIEKLRERICTDEPPRPSRRLASTDPAVLSRIADSCETAPAKLIKQLGDDLDWIVMQCMDKEPQRRYQTVNDLITDLEHYLRHEPVHARPPTFFYSFRKLARRNRLAFASTIVSAGFVLFITAFAVITALQAQRIAAERDQAERERQLAQKVSNVALNVFAIADPFQTFDYNVSPSALLAQAAKSIERELTDQPGPRARLLLAIGRAYVRRGEFKPSIEYLTAAIHTLSQMDGGDTESLAAITYLAYALRNAGDLQGARRVSITGDYLAKRRGLQRSAAYAKLLLDRGYIELEGAQVTQARADFESSLSTYRAVVGDRTLEVAEVLSALAMVSAWTDDHVQAERLAREALSIYEAAVPPIHPDRVFAEIRLAEVLRSRNKVDEAAELLTAAIRKEIQIFGRDSGQVADALDSLAIVRYSQGQFNEAKRLSGEAIDIGRTVYGDGHFAIANMGVTLGRTLIELKEYPEAEATLRRSLNVLLTALPPDNQYAASAEYFLGEVLLASNRLIDAEAVLTSSMDRWKRNGAPTWRAMRSASALGEVLYREGRAEEAAKYLSESLRVLSADGTADAATKEKANERFARYIKKSSLTQHAPQTTKLTIETQ